MKPLLHALLPVLALLAVSFPGPLCAVPPVALYTLQGEVVSIEAEHQRFTVRTVRTPSGIRLSWGPGTQFFRSGKLVPAASLTRGQRVTVRYRTPFFGPRIASRVFLTSDKEELPKLPSR
jgi:hypothetical protein